MKNFGKVITAMITPMKTVKNRVEIDYEAARKLAVYLINNGSDALVLSGTTGEASTVHREEKAQLVKEVQDALRTSFPNKSVDIIVGVGSNDTEHTIDNGLDAKKLGVSALLVVSPYYSRPSQKGIFEHYAAVVKATDMPVMIYDVPSRSSVKIDPDTYLKLAEIPSIVAVKDSTGNAYQVYKRKVAIDKLRANLGLEPLMLYCGDDSLLLPFLSFGATGIVSVASHICGRTFQKVVECLEQVDLASARTHLEKTIDVVDIVNGTGQQAAMTKAIMQQLGVIPSRVMRLPNAAVGDECAHELLRKLEEMGY
ncbi:MAG: 4-hydroxy-tetrahydrodipicolinate synthase [Candidatus Ancillula trichonymphae]|jgi:4-hydroxy-tetrahydrodipicolinate synthase|nr:4-hydroxy-tetrahydrodipicolinate synthase [Candidatus Ancillula trichonymphae]